MSCPRRRQRIPALGWRWVVGACIASLGCGKLLDLDHYQFASLGPELCETIGETRHCALSDTPACTDGSQRCTADGVWSLCRAPDEAVCRALPASGGDAGPEVLAGMGGGTGVGVTDPGGGGPGSPNDMASCAEGSTEPCGPETNTGVCEFGVRRCELGLWSDCEGAVLPSPRDCASEADNDCDGRADNTLDEGCRCAVGSAEPCEEHPGRDGRGPCRAGERACFGGPGGTTSDWSECEGAVGPESSDLCDVPGDDANCDGTRNGLCECVNGETQECGPATDTGICQFGVSTCVDQQFGPCDGAVFAEARDCSSSADNDCDGRPDNTLDQVCNCLIGDSRACETHPGRDGNGQCVAGEQLCTGGLDNRTSRFGTCVGSVGPLLRDLCTRPGDDSDCDGIENDNCVCPYCDGVSLRSCGDGITPDATVMTCAYACAAAGNAFRCTPPRDISLGSDHTCVVVPPSGRVACVGSTHLRFISPAELGGPAVQVGAGNFHTCALLDSGDVKCWGLGDEGQLGYGNTNDITTIAALTAAGRVEVGGPVSQLAVGYDHTCVLLRSGAVRCWGVGGEGRLGYGNTDDVGDNETPASRLAVDVGGTVTELVLGIHHTCALIANGDVRCWGEGLLGQHGRRTQVNIGDDEPPSASLPVTLGGATSQLSAGDNHTCALLTAGGVRCWGASGALGIENSGNIGDDEHPNARAALALGNVVQLAAGGSHTCALLAAGSVHCWGNFPSALGYGVDRTLVNATLAGAVNVGAPVQRIAAGSFHTCAVIDTGAVRCWGDNFWGQLGFTGLLAIGDDESPASVGDVRAF